MMCGQPSDQWTTASKDNGSIENWRQGDFATKVGGFLFATQSDGEDHFDAAEQMDDIVGLVVISQTCDIVRDTGGRHYVAVCPLIEVPKDEINSVLKGRRPYLADVENAGDTAFADLRRVMSIDKRLLQTWNRRVGFSSEETKVRFAAALERKFGQFAFPDDFDFAMRPLRERVWSRHGKHNSLPGKIYRSIAQIRFRSDPDWSSEMRHISIVVVLNSEENREASREEINSELENTLDKVALPIGYEWASPKFILGTAKDLTAEDITSSRRGDFDFLCY